MGLSVYLLPHQLVSRHWSTIPLTLSTTEQVSWVHVTSAYLLPHQLLNKSLESTWLSAYLLPYPLLKVPWVHVTFSISLTPSTSLYTWSPPYPLPHQLVSRHQVYCISSLLYLLPHQLDTKSTIPLTPSRQQVHTSLTPSRNRVHISYPTN